MLDLITWGRSPLELQLCFRKIYRRLPLLSLMPEQRHADTRPLVGKSKGLVRIGNDRDTE
jgi:hypothetical protein